MTFKQSLRTREQRILKKLANYKTADELNKYTLGDLLEQSEDIIGMYQNNETATERNMIITDLGLRLFMDSNWHLIPYSQMSDVHVPMEGHITKITASELVLTLDDEVEIVVAVTGGSEKTRDIWEFFRFMRRVMSDYRKHEGKT